MTQRTDQNFSHERFLPKSLFERISEVRAQNPDAVQEEASRLEKRPSLAPKGKLMIVATDHPGRRVTGLRNEPLAMANRHAYLARAIRVLTAPGCDGIMGTPDFMEEILIISHLVRMATDQSWLDGKVLIGCMNRGGFAGVKGEIDDRFTAFTARQLKRLRFEGGKFMYRLVMEDERTIKAIDDCAQAVNSLFREGLYSFLEPLHMRQTKEGGYEQIIDAKTLSQDVGATAALGESASKTWLKIPYCESYETVARATTLPILMLGGPAQDSPEPTLRNFAAGMRAAANVRGVMVGRNITFVKDDDPRAIAAAVGAIVHRGSNAEEALSIADEERGKQAGLLAGV